MNTNQPGREYPDGYYFDPENKNAPVVVPENAETAPVAKAEMSPSEVAKSRREGVKNFFANAKENLKNKVVSAGNKISGFFSKAGTKIRAFGNKALDVAIAPDAYAKKGMENVANFVADKKDKLVNFANGRIEMARLVGEFAKNKTVETYNDAKNAVTERYEGLKQYGADAIESGKNRIRSVKEGVRAKKNSIIARVIEAYLKFAEARAETAQAESKRRNEKVQKLQSLLTLVQSV